MLAEADFNAHRYVMRAHVIRITLLIHSRVKNRRKNRWRHNLSLELTMLLSSFSMPDH